MKKSVLRKYSSVFLATVLVAGIIAVSSPSFMMGAHAQKEYGMDNYNKKVKVEKIKCDNQNFNIDVLNPDIIPEITSDLMKLKEQNKQDYRVLDDQIILLCTNYNDPVKFPGAQPAEQNEKALTAQQKEVVGCEDCLKKLGTGLQERLITSIANLPNPIIQLGEVTLDFTKIAETSTLGDIGNTIDAAVKADGPISLTEIISTFNDLLPDLDAEGQDQVAEAILCLLKSKILERDAGMTVG